MGVGWVHAYFPHKTGPLRQGKLAPNFSGGLNGNHIKKENEDMKL